MGMPGRSSTQVAPGRERSTQQGHICFQLEWLLVPPLHWGADSHLTSARCWMESLGGAGEGEWVLGSGEVIEQTFLGREAMWSKGRG